MTFRLVELAHLLLSDLTNGEKKKMQFAIESNFAKGITFLDMYYVHINV